MIIRNTQAKYLQDGPTKKEKRYHFDNQSLSFMIDILPEIHEVCKNIYSNAILDKSFTGIIKIADVGACTASGTKLLADYYSPFSINRIKCNITAIDIDDTYKTELDEYRNASYEIVDIFKIDDKTFDLAICSHTLEHLSDPYAFILQLKKISKYNVIFACPVDELLRDPLVSHPRLVTKHYFSTLGKNTKFYESNNWFGHCGVGVDECAFTQQDVEYLKSYYIENDVELKLLDRCNEAIRICKSRATPYFKIANLYLNKNENLFLKNLLMASTLDPFYMPYYYSCFSYLYKKFEGSDFQIHYQNNPNNVKRAIGELINIFESVSYFCYFYAGKMYEKYKYYHEAINCFSICEKQLSVFMLDGYFIYNVAQGYKQLGDIEKAYSIVSDAALKYRSNFMINFLKSQIECYNRHEYDKAIKTLQPYLSRNYFYPALLKTLVDSYSHLNNISLKTHFQELLDNFR